MKIIRTQVITRSLTDFQLRVSTCSGVTFHLLTRPFPDPIWPILSVPTFLSNHPIQVTRSVPIDSVITSCLKGIKRVISFESFLTHKQINRLKRKYFLSQDSFIWSLNAGLYPVSSRKFFFTLEITGSSHHPGGYLLRL